jgi:hypothetical protein
MAVTVTVLTVPDRGSAMFVHSFVSKLAAQFFLALRVAQVCWYKRRVKN